MNRTAPRIASHSIVIICYSVWLLVLGLVACDRRPQAGPEQAVEAPTKEKYKEPATPKFIATAPDGISTIDDGVDAEHNEQINAVLYDLDAELSTTQLPSEFDFDSTSLAEFIEANREIWGTAPENRKFIAIKDDHDHFAGIKLGMTIFELIDACNIDVALPTIGYMVSPSQFDDGGNAMTKSGVHFSFAINSRSGLVTYITTEDSSVRFRGLGAGATKADVEQTLGDLAIFQQHEAYYPTIHFKETGVTFCFHDGIPGEGREFDDESKVAHIEMRYRRFQ